MSARSWFSISTTTNWSKLPVASGDKCPGLAIVTGAAIGTRPDPSSATTTSRIAVRAAPRARLMPALPRVRRERRGLRPGRMRATRGGNQGTSEGNVSRPGSRLYPDSEPAIESGCCNAEQSRRRERQTNGEFDGNREGLQIVRLVSFLYPLFEFLPPVPRLLARPRVPAVTATDQDEAHGGEDHDEQGEGPRDPEGEIREGQGGGFVVKRSRGGRLAARVVDRLHPDLVGTVGQVEGGARCGADG